MDGARAPAFATFAVARVPAGDCVLPDAGVDGLFLILPRSGAIEFETDMAEGRCEAGSILLVDMGRAMDIRSGGGEAVRLAVPHALARLTPQALCSLHGSTVDGRVPAGRFLAAQIELLLQLSADMQADGRAQFAEVVAMVLSAAVRLAVTCEPGAQAQAEDLSVASVRAFVAANLSDLTLSPARICAEFGVSRSVLYRLVEPLGGVSSFIRNQRLERARLVLAAATPGRGGVASVARAVGFPNEAAFSRAFRARYGASPSEMAGRGDRARRPAEAQGRWMRSWLANARLTA